MTAAHMEAWSTGAVRMEVDDGHQPVTATVEVLRISRLVQVLARADTDDPAFRAGFPIVMATVELYPAVSLARDPLVELGKTVADAFFAQVIEHVKKQLAAAPPRVPD